MYSLVKFTQQQVQSHYSSHGSLASYPIQIFGFDGVYVFNLRLILVKMPKNGKLFSTTLDITRSIFKVSFHKNNLANEHSRKGFPLGLSWLEKLSRQPLSYAIPEQSLLTPKDSEIKIIPFFPSCCVWVCVWWTHEHMGFPTLTHIWMDSLSKTKLQKWKSFQILCGVYWSHSYSHKKCGSYDYFSWVSIS